MFRLLESTLVVGLVLLVAPAGGSASPESLVPGTVAGPKWAMRRFVAAALVPGKRTDTGPAVGPRPVSVPGVGSTRIVVGYTAAGYAAAPMFEREFGAETVARIGPLHADVLRFVGGDATAVLAILRADPRVRYAELDRV